MGLKRIFIEQEIIDVEKKCNFYITRDDQFGKSRIHQYIIQKKEKIMKEKVQAALNKVRPMLQADGGDVELVDVEGGIVKVRLQGACAGCPMSQMTLKNGIENFLKKEIPEVESVISAD